MFKTAKLRFFKNHNTNYFKINNMECKVKKFTYNGSMVEFEIKNENVKVNATEMAKIFGKQVEVFMRSGTTKNFIDECLKSENSRFLGIEKEEDLVVSKQRSGTWMHRVLALKFAAWLNPAFELWVYRTIDDLLFNNKLRQKNYFKEKRELYKRKRALDADIKTIRTRIASTPDGMELAGKQQKLKEVKAQIAQLEQNEFGAVYSLFDKYTEQNKELSIGA